MGIKIVRWMGVYKLKARGAGKHTYLDGVYGRSIRLMA